MLSSSDRCLRSSRAQSGGTGQQEKPPEENVSGRNRKLKTVKDPVFVIETSTSESISRDNGDESLQCGARPEEFCIEGLDFNGHCPMCLRKLINGRSNSPNVIALDEEGRNGEEGMEMVEAMSMPFDSMGHIWQCLHTGGPSNEMLPKCTFKKNFDRMETRIKGPENSLNRLNEIPEICTTCYSEVLKLHCLHRQLELIQVTIKSQVNSIRKVVLGAQEGSQDKGFSRRDELERLLLYAHKKEEIPKVLRFIRYIDGVSFNSASDSSSLMATEQEKPESAEGQRKSRKSLCTPETSVSTMAIGTDETEDTPSDPISVTFDDFFDDNESQNDPFHVTAIKEEHFDNDNCDNDSWKNNSSSCSNEDEEDDSDEDGSDPDYQGSSKREANTKPAVERKSTKPRRTRASSGNFNCTECDMRFIKPTTLRSHFLKVHSNGEEKGPAEILKCDVCGKIFKYRPFLQFHKKFEKCSLAKTTVKLSWSCNSCEKIFLTRRELRSHKLNEHTDEKFKKLPRHRCNVCNTTFLNFGHLKAHKKVHEGAPLVCEVCGQTFKKLRFLRQHRSMHTGELPICCEICGQRFRLQAFLLQHKKHVHRDVAGGTHKEFPCTLCGKVFYMSKKLKIHMLIHSDQRAFVCETCGLGFKTKGNLRSHSKRHSRPQAADGNEGEHACTKCNRFFNKRRTLLAHNKMHHSNWTPYSCDECQIGFKTKYLLKDHQNAYHIKRVDGKSDDNEPSHSDKVKPANDCIQSGSSTDH